jgi:hypothetical protein
MGNRPTASTLIEAKAGCERCAWSITAKNAQALAAQHFDKKGHRVRVTTTTEIVYGRHSSETGKGASQGSLKL